MRLTIAAALVASVSGPALAQNAATGTPWFKTVRGDVSAATASGTPLSTVASQAANALTATGNGSALNFSNGSTSKTGSGLLSSQIADEAAILSLQNAASAAGAFTSGTDLSSNPIKATGAATTQTAAQIAALANAAMQASALPTTPIAATYGTVSQTLAARFSDSINARDYGAKCDGVSDDTTALQASIDAATGNITASTALTAAQKTQLSALSGVGLHPNGGVQLILPSGACEFNGTLTAALPRNAGFAMVGDGTSNTQLVHRSGTGDGLDINLTQNPSDLAHSSQWPGQAVLLRGFNMQNGTGTQSGTAIKIVGSTRISYANLPPHNLIEDVSVSDAGGWGTLPNGPSSSSGWTQGIQAQDLTYLFINRAQIVDDSGLMTHGIEYNSTATASTAPSYSPPGNLIVQDVQMMHGGGKNYLDVSGYGVQAVWVIRPQFVTQGTGITWLAAANSSSGSLVVEDGSGAATTASVQATNLGTVIEHDNFWYTPNTLPTNSNWYGSNIQSVVDFNEHDDTVYEVPSASLTAGYKSYATYFTAATGLTGSQGQSIPNSIHHITVAGDGVGVAAQGANTLVDGIICRNCTSAVQDLYTGSDNTQHPHFENIVTGPNSVMASGGYDAVGMLAASYQYAFPIELGNVGATTPEGLTGIAGRIDGHSVAGSNDYDQQLLAVGGTAGAVGQGGWEMVGAAGVKVDGPLSAPSVATGTVGVAGSPVYTPASFFQAQNGPVLAPAFREIGFANPASATAACDAGTFGFGGTGSGLYAYNCVASGDWRWSPMFSGAPGGTATWPGVLALAGGVSLPTVSAVPTGATPTITGTVPFVVDTSNSTGYFWNGTAWVSVGGSGTTTAAPSTVSATKTAAFAYTAAVDSIEVSNASATAYAVTLPACTSANNGEAHGIAKIDANTNPITLTASGTDTISGAATVSIATQWLSIQVKCDGNGTWLRGLH